MGINGRMERGVVDRRIGDNIKDVGKKDLRNGEGCWERLRKGECRREWNDG